MKTLGIQLLRDFMVGALTYIIGKNTRGVPILSTLGIAFCMDVVSNAASGKEQNFLNSALYANAASSFLYFSSQLLASNRSYAVNAIVAIAPVVLLNIVEIAELKIAEHAV